MKRLLLRIMVRIRQFILCCLILGIVVYMASEAVMFFLAMFRAITAPEYHMTTGDYVLGVFFAPLFLAVIAGVVPVGFVMVQMIFADIKSGVRR